MNNPNQLNELDLEQESENDDHTIEPETPTNNKEPQQPFEYKEQEFKLSDGVNSCEVHLTTTSPYEGANIALQLFNAIKQSNKETKSKSMIGVN